MSAQDVSKFEDQVRKDPQLVAELQSLRSVVDERALPQKIAEVARKHGFSISADEVDDYLKGLASRSELSDESLSGVAGGSAIAEFSNMPKCLTTSGCGPNYTRTLESCGDV